MKEERQAMRGCKLVYQHQHDCACQGEEMAIRPAVQDGVIYKVVPVCIETMTELVELVDKREVW